MCTNQPETDAKCQKHYYLGDSDDDKQFYGMVD